MPSVTIHELTAAGIVLAHGVIFLTPPPTFPLSINYRVMDSIAPEWLWGVAFVVIVIVWGGGILSRRLRWRQVILSVLAVVIFWMGASFFLSNINTTIGYTLLIVGAGTFAARVGLR
jgi:hypothetical protein